MDAYVQGAQRTVDRVVGELGEMRETFEIQTTISIDFCGIVVVGGSWGQTDPMCIIL